MERIYAQYDHNVEEDELILAKRDGLSARDRLVSEPSPLTLTLTLTLPIILTLSPSLAQPSDPTNPNPKPNQAVQQRRLSKLVLERQVSIVLD